LGKNSHDQPAIRRIDGTLPSLFPGFQHVDAGFWRALLRCPVCGQLWVADEWEKYQIQLAVKIADAESWSVLDEAQCKEYLAQSRGENAAARCMWNGCDKSQLNGSAYCVDHLYATGARA
jgi:hypothetical protein